MNKKLIVKQEEPSDCGVCSLLSIIRYYHGDASLESLRISSLTSKDGVTALNLINCAIEYGFDAVGKKLDKIPIDELPCIAHIRINNSLSHFMVIYSIKDDYVEVMDPSMTYKKIKIDEFYKLTSNIYISLKPKGQIEYQHNPNLIYRNLNSFIINNKLTILKIIFFNFVYIIISVVYSFYISILTNYFLLKLIISFIIVLITSNFMIYLINVNMNKLNNNVSFSLIDSFISHIFNLPLNYIHIKDSNEIIKRVIDLDSIKSTLISFITTLITNLILIIIVSIILFIINHLSVLFVIFGFIGYLLITIMFKDSYDNIDKVIKEDTNYNSSLIDYIEGLNSIKHSSSESIYKESLLNDYKTNNLIKYKYSNTLYKIDFLKQSYILIIEFLLNVYIIYMIRNNILTYEYLFIINLLFQLIVNSITSIVNYIPSVLYQNKIITKVNDFFNIKEELIDNKRIKDNNIRINNLSFSYNNYINTIKNINLVINKGEKLIIKGESGCGKSTLCKILNKEYLNYKGDIYLGNINYKDISVSEIRNLISYSSQDEKIFHGTIKDNILMGHTISNHYLEDIIDTCELKRIIDKRIYGLDTYLFAGGDELSGGEKQLIILARSLVLNKNILILDESLSEVNDKVEDKVLSKLFKKYKNKTIIYVSHKNKKNYFKRTYYV